MLRTATQCLYIKQIIQRNASLSEQHCPTPRLFYPFPLSPMAATLATTAPGPFDPVAPSEIRLASSILSAALPGVPLRYKRVSLHEPVKRDVIPYIEA